MTDDAMHIDAPEAPAVPAVPSTGYPAASAPAAAPAAADGMNAADDDELFVDIGECRDFDEGEDPEVETEMAVEEDEEEVVDQSELTLPNTGSVLCCAASTTEALVCTGNQDDKAILFRLGAGEASATTLEGHTDSVVSVAFSHDGQLLATGSYDHSVRIWTAQGQLVHKLEGPAAEVEWIAWHPKGNALLAGSNDCTAWLWWAPTAKLMQVFAGHSSAVGCGCFANQGKSIVTGSSAGELIVWNPKQGTTVHFKNNLHENGVLCVRGHPTMPIVATGGFDGGVAVIQVETGKELVKLPGHTNEVEAVDFFESSSSHMLASGGIDGTVRVYDCQQWGLRCKIDAAAQLGFGVSHLRWHPTEPWVISTGTDKRVRVHDARSGAEVCVKSGHRKDVYEFALLLHDGVRVVTASDDGTAKVFVI